MSLHRFFVPPDQCGPDTIRLSGPEAHHAAHVLRVRRGDRAIVLDGCGRQVTCTVQDVSSREITLEKVNETHAPSPPCQTTLFQAVPKGKIFEFIIQKATELGVSRIVPVITERVVSRPHESDLEKKEQKWQSTAIEAVKQCGQPWLPQVEEPQCLEVALKNKPQIDLELVGALSGKTRSPRAWFNDFLKQHQHKPSTAAAWIGPEGDFSPAELEAILNAGARPVTLGPLVLRCETAAVYSLSVINYEISTMCEQ